MTITEEWLYSWPHGKRTILFSRFDSEVSLGRALRGNKAAIKDVVRPNSLFLSAGAANNNRTLGRISQFFDQNHMRVHERADHRFYETTFSHVVRKASRDPQLMDLIRFADLGIVGWQEKPQAEFENPRWSEERARLMREWLASFGGDTSALEFPATWLHEAASDASVSLPADWESYGTVEWMFLINNALSILRGGGALFVDDLGGYLHPSLVAQLVKLFSQPTTNKHGAQLIFNTHDVSLLWRGSQAHLGRDQIWFTKKSRDGATSLYPLTDFRARDNVDDFMGRYLHGRYEGVPYFDDDLLQSLREDEVAS